MKILLSFLFLLIIVFVVLCFVLPNTEWSDYSLPLTSSLTTPEKPIPSSDPALAAEKARILKEHDGHTDDLNDVERHIVFADEYAEAENLPELAYFITLILVFSGFGTIYGHSSFHAKVSLVCCLILLFFSWKLIALALFIDVVLIPTLGCMAVKGLFSK